jgi:glycosyltransferase involved in cell wall biosynthesis
MTSKITVITPTADQPLGIALLEKYMARQTVLPDQWIVADDGIKPATMTMGQEHIVTPRKYDLGRSLSKNIILGLKAATGDIIIIMEHDDYYTANHIEVCIKHLENTRATGSRLQRYYNVEHRCWLEMNNVGSSLCNTAFTKDLIPQMNNAANMAFNNNLYCVDRLFWDSLAYTRHAKTHDINTVVGIKGLPGRKGLGLGHRPNASRTWHSDPEFTKLSEWIGDDIQYYLPTKGAL